MKFVYTISVLIALAFSAAKATASPNEPSMFKNPLIEQRADPWIYRHTDGMYYFTASVPEYDRIEIRCAASIEELADAKAKTVWRRHETGVMGRHIWAPEIHFVDGKWYIHFAAGAAEDIWAIRMWVLENGSPNPLEGEWVEKGQVHPKWDSFSLDATTFEHRGKRYYIWAQSDPNIGPGTSLYISEMANPWTLTGPQVRISTPQYDWEVIGHRVNEGPGVVKHDGRIFVTFSASATDANYCTGLLWIGEDAGLLDAKNWHKKTEPVLRSTPEAKIYGPGHNSFTTVTTAEGERDVMIYHARSYEKIDGDPLYDPNRHTRVLPFEWDDEGMPVFSLDSLITVK